MDFIAETDGGDLTEIETKLKECRLQVKDTDIEIKEGSLKGNF